MGVLINRARTQGQLSSYSFVNQFIVSILILDSDTFHTLVINYYFAGTYKMFHDMNESMSTEAPCLPLSHHFNLAVHSNFLSVVSASQELRVMFTSVTTLMSYK